MGLICLELVLKIRSLFFAVCCALSLSITPVLAKESAKKPRVLHICKKNDTELNILACNMYKEGRGEGDYGMMGVAFATLNRKDDKNFPHTIKKVVYQPGQFSWTFGGQSFKVYEKDRWLRAKFYARILMRLHKDHKSLYKALDYTKSATYYHATTVRPSWAKVMVKTVKVGNHIFYKHPDA